MRWLLESLLEGDFGLVGILIGIVLLGGLIKVIFFD